MASWALLAEFVPLYPLYSLLFVHAGLSRAEISGLFALWSASGFMAEIPAGALADRFSRRAAIAVAGVSQACGYSLWAVVPGLVGFAAGFVLWGLGGALSSGALEALLYDGLAEVGAESRFPSVLGVVSAAGLLAQLPTALAASLLLSAGGYPLVAWVSVGCCLGAAMLAVRLPEASRRDGRAETASYLVLLRAGVVEALTRPALRGAVAAVALVSGVDAIEEYFPLLAQSWGVAVRVVPLAVVGIPVAGAACALLAGRASGLRPSRPGTLACLLGAGALVLGLVGLLQRPVGLAGVAIFYGLFRLVLVVVEARLQERIAGPSRSTVTSVAAMLTEVVTLGVFGAWALGGVEVVVAGLSAVVVVLPWLLRSSKAQPPADASRAES
ncbi:MAG: MFS transporter [Acidimicrobiales bacterium]